MKPVALFTLALALLGAAPAVAGSSAPTAPRCLPDAALMHQSRHAPDIVARVQATAAMASQQQRCIEANNAKDTAGLAAIAAMHEERRQRKLHGDASALKPGECVVYANGTQWCPSDACV